LASEERQSEESQIAGNHLALLKPNYDRALDILGTSIDEEGPRNLFFKTQTSNYETERSRTEGNVTV
jgi:hypothetical protein